jgi:hypothetical protein
MRRVLVVVVLGFGLGMPACRYAKDYVRSVAADAQRRIAQPRTPEEACHRRDGVFHQGQCYTPEPEAAALNKEDCRLRGGLYMDDQCFLVSRGNTARSTP